MHPADPRHRRIVAWTVVAIALLSIGLARATRPYAEAWYERYAEELPDRSAEELRRDYRLLALMAGAGSALPLVLMAGTFLYQGIRIRRSSRFPYPGMWILRDTPIETGDAARRRAHRLVVTAACLAALGIAAAWWLFRLFMRALESAGMDA